MPTTATRKKQRLAAPPHTAVRLTTAGNEAPANEITRRQEAKRGTMRTAANTIVYLATAVLTTAVGSTTAQAERESFSATEGQTSALTYRMEVTIHGVAGCDDGIGRAEYYVRIEPDSAEDRAALQATEDAALQVVGGRGNRPQEVLRSLERRRAASDLVPLNEAERHRFEQLRGARRSELTDDEAQERRLLAGRVSLSAIEARQLELLQRLDARATEQRLRLRMFAGIGRRNYERLLDYLHVQAGESIRIALFEDDPVLAETCLRTTTTLDTRTLERGSRVIEHEGPPALTLRFSR